MSDELLKMVDLGRVKSRLFQFLEHEDPNISLSGASLLIQLYRLPSDDALAEFKGLAVEMRAWMADERAKEAKEAKKL